MGVQLAAVAHAVYLLTSKSLEESHECAIVSMLA